MDDPTLLSVRNVPFDAAPEFDLKKFLWKTQTISSARKLLSF